MLRSSDQHYQDVQRLSALTVAASRRAWRRLDIDDLDGSYRDLVAPALILTLTEAQAAAASSAGRYVADALIEQGIDAPPDGSLRPRSLAGVASDGWPLARLLRSPLTRAKTLVGAGVADPIGAALPSLERIMVTQVADANRAAESVAIASRAKVGGYVRQLNLPSCSRCIVLAGAWYRWNKGFQRHPGCDCTHIPAAEDSAGDLTTSPQRAFDSLTAAEQDRAFTKAGAQAIRDGADPSRVVNARRGMTTAADPSGRRRLVRSERGVFETAEATTRRGRLPGQAQGLRLMPESIYELASDRAEAIGLLRRYGYIT